MERRRAAWFVVRRHDRGDNAALNLYRQGLAADVEGVSDGRRAAAPGEASTRRIVPDVSGSQILETGLSVSWPITLGRDKAT